ncbi:N-acetyltransferase [Actinomadura rupiterrae]|uniref:N-acetyltransferase n=1 Tax=Actinomadura rupiterrae TaxID=559627 RepID=UPI0020A39C7C|nr:N-acetyltransferase [Actinomadura rupiterrae]MCP2338252.1 GNAT superfamily N-acetyltransferase [Actinomadura rupiterrae]
MEITTLAERPGLEHALLELSGEWPGFTGHEPVTQSRWAEIPQVFPEFVLVATEGRELVARGFSVPFRSRGALPGTGWDQVMIWAFRDHAAEMKTDTVSAIEITIRGGRRGTGLSGRMLEAMRANAKAHGFSELVAPVRPNAKHLEPKASMAEYAFRTREDGLPHDPWLRVHIRAGGVIDSIAPASMVVAGSLDQWRDWTDLPFDLSGPVEVPGALVPVTCSLEHDQAVYVEPNVWVRHSL